MKQVFEFNEDEALVMIGKEFFRQHPEWNFEGFRVQREFSLLRGFKYKVSVDVSLRDKPRSLDLTERQLEFLTFKED